MTSPRKNARQPAKADIILASSSPRRIQMLKNVGLHCVVVSPSVDETPKRNEKPASLVARLALEKAQSAVSCIKRKNGAATTIIIAADTIVVEPQGRILGKPVSKAEAMKMLGKLQGAVHTVLTGYCILETKPDQGEGYVHSHVRVVKSRVRMRALSRSQIRAYVGTGEPMDKAGSYAAQGIGMALIESIEGSYANVVGLPISQVSIDLEQYFGIKTFG